MRYPLRFFLFVLIFSSASGQIVRAAENPPSPIQISFLDVGQGDAILVRASDGFDALIDGGRKSTGENVLTALRQGGVDDLEALIATHADSDHIGGLIKVLQAEDIPVETAFYNGYPGDTHTWSEFETAVAAEGLSLLPAQYPQTYSWGGLAVYVFNPPADLIDPNQNEASLVLLLDAGEVEVLLTADIDAGVEAVLIQRGDSLAAEILKVAHHGSKTSTSAGFLEAVQPLEAIISVGPNSYGHPAPEALQRLKEAGARLWRTDFAGTITVSSDGFTYTITPVGVYLPILMR